ncbi:hypothetical protein DND62_24210 [Pseudomonas syringae pv. pisi]|jgi:hypothetical protein|nr:hypothetical protein DND62_24210 [Pseudomonas syringae pv. pisi]
MTLDLLAQVIYEITPPITTLESLYQQSARGPGASEREDLWVTAAQQIIKLRGHHAALPATEMTVPLEPISQWWWRDY